MAAHPMYDNYVLLSCDSSLRLIDLSLGNDTTIREYNTREVAAGVITIRLLYSKLHGIDENTGQDQSVRRLRVCRDMGPAELFTATDGRGQRRADLEFAYRKA